MSEDQRGEAEAGREFAAATPAEAGPAAEQNRFTKPIPMRIPPPPAPRPRGDRWRAATVGVLNLSGLGVGYALMRRWRAAAGCWIATGILLVIALPPDANGVPGALIVLYLLVLVLAAVHGAWRGLRTPLTWPRRPPVAAALAAVLLVVPVGGAALYDHAHVDAVQQLLLGRLAGADQLVAGTAGEPFADAESQDDAAMAVYRDLLEHDGSSRAGRLVPGRLDAFYQTVAAPYTRDDYCDAIAPLTYLRTLSGSFSSGTLGSLATWPDDRLATSLYQCGVAALGTGGNSTATTDLNELLSTFPASSQAGGIASAAAAVIGKAAAGIGGSKSCSVTDTLQTLDTQVSAISGGTAAEDAALQKAGDEADADVESGTYACGVAQYRSGDFNDAETTMNDFTSTYPHDKNKALAQNYSIAAQIAEQEPAAGKVVPTLASGGDVQVTFLNDSPDPVDVLYTGPVTGTVHIGACGKCSTYGSTQEGQQDACSDSGIDYPQATIDLQPGTTYILQQDSDGSSANANASSQQYEAGNAYEGCLFETSIFGSLP